MNILQHSHSSSVECYSLANVERRTFSHIWIVLGFPGIELSVNLVSDPLTVASFGRLFSPYTTPQKVSRWLLSQRV